MSDAAPEIYAKFGEEILGPWDHLSTDVREAWMQLAQDVADRQEAGA